MYVSCSVGIILIGVLASVVVNEESACQQHSWYNYGNDSCIFIISSSPTVGQVYANVACKRILRDDSWGLPIMDTAEKAAELNAILEKVAVNVGRELLAFWIRLQRDVPYNDSEAQNLTEWKNPTKWSWGPGQSTLKNWDAWKPERIGFDAQPDNSNYRSANIPLQQEDLAMMTELCVMAVQFPKEKFNWYDMVCRPNPDLSEVQINSIRFMLVCQATKKQDSSSLKTPVATPPTSSIATPPTSSIATSTTSSIATSLTSTIATPTTSSITTPPTSSIATPTTSSIAMLSTSSTGKPLPSPGSTLPPSTTPMDTRSSPTTGELNQQKPTDSADPATTKPPFSWPWLVGGLAVAWCASQSHWCASQSRSSPFSFAAAVAEGNRKRSIIVTGINAIIEPEPIRPAVRPR